MKQTLLLIKPDAVRRRCIGAILFLLEQAGFVITGLKMQQLNRAEAEEFYAVHKGKEFFSGLVEFMTSGPIVAARLEAPDAPHRLRQLVGATDPAQAAPGTIRATFGTSVRMNAVHAANPDEDVARELGFFFSETTANL